MMEKIHHEMLKRKGRNSNMEKKVKVKSNKREKVHIDNRYISLRRYKS